jgi:glutamate decarboxylase
MPEHELIIVNKTDYPLPPNEEKTEILRIVVRESMSMDLLDRLINDIVEVTENLMKSDAIDLAAWQPTPSSVEKKHANPGLGAHQKHHSKNPMHNGIHRSVC